MGKCLISIFIFIFPPKITKFLSQIYNASLFQRLEYCIKISYRLYKKSVFLNKMCVMQILWEKEKNFVTFGNELLIVFY